MSAVRGLGRFLGAVGGPSDLIVNAGIFPSDPSAAIVADWFFPPGPPPVVEIPYAWLSPPLAVRQDKPFTSAAVTGGGATARGFNAASRTEYGDNEFAATLTTNVTADPAALVSYVLAYFATQSGGLPRSRFLALRVRLNGRTVPEKMRLLGLSIGQRLRITGTPSTWPAGATEQVVEGRHDILDANARDIELNTSPIVGVSPGVTGPWFYTDRSLTDGTDVMPF